MKRNTYLFKKSFGYYNRNKKKQGYEVKFHIEVSDLNIRPGVGS